MGKVTFSPLQSEQINWLKNRQQDLHHFISEFSPIDSFPRIDAYNRIGLDVLDRAFASALRSGSSDPQITERVIGTIGVAFGQRLVNEAGFEWVIVTDDYGTELAVRAFPEKAEIVICPMDFVAKRWEDGVTNFLDSGYEEIMQHVEEIKAEWKGK